MLTYLGNKRGLLDLIDAAIAGVRQDLGGRKLRAVDLFAGSGIVSRLLKQHSSWLCSNDLEAYAACTARCYLANRRDLDPAAIRAAVQRINQLARAEPRPGFIQELYAPADDEAIGPGERVFYTGENARFLDAARQHIAAEPEELQTHLLAPLLAQASVHANTAGVFKGFYKDRRTGLGRFGGTGGDALSRIRARIEIPMPVYSRFDCEVEVQQRDARDLAEELPPVDLVYLDPPYNQHPYGSNYFMLNLLTRYERPTELSRVSGIPVDWTRSVFNRRPEAEAALAGLLAALPARYLLVSFNSEGFIRPDRMRAMLASLGEVQVLERPHPTFRGSRNLRQRSLQVREYLFVCQRAT